MIPNVVGVFTKPLLFVFIFFTLKLFSQPENSFLYLNPNSFIKFINDSTPTFYEQNNILDHYFTTSIADKRGNLVLFATNKTIWDANKNVVLTNPKATFNSINPVIILPIVSDTNLYAHIAFDQYAMRYAVYNKSTQTIVGLQTSIAGISDSMYINNFGFRSWVTATGSANCRGVWYMTSGVNEITSKNYFFLNKIANVSDLNKITISTVVGTNGQTHCRFSSSGNKILCSTQNHNPRYPTEGGYPAVDSMFIFDFNSITGEIKFQQKIGEYRDKPIFSLVTAQLSPNDRYLYFYSLSRYFIQRDLLTGAKQIIYDSIAPKINFHFISFPIINLIYNRFYILGSTTAPGYQNNRLSVSVINYPDLPWPACKFEVNKFTSELPMAGNLPNQVQAHFGRDYGFKIKQTCVGDSVLFEGPALAPNEDKYVWKFSDGFTSTLPGIKRKITQAQTVNLRYNYCDVIDNVPIPPAKPNRLADTLLCGAHTFLLNTIFGTNYIINADTIKQKVVAKQGSNYFYAQNDCFTVRDTFEADIHYKLPKPFGSDTTLCMQPQLTLTAGTDPSYAYTWNSGNTKATETVSENGTVTLIRKNKCFTDTFSLKVMFIKPVDTKSIANVFTPNADNINDTWQTIAQPVENYSLTIYNRWGTKVFESQFQSQIWDAQSQPDGVYFYHIGYSDCQNQPQSVKGTIQVLR